MRLFKDACLCNLNSLYTQYIVFRKYMLYYLCNIVTYTQAVVARLMWPPCLFIAIHLGLLVVGLIWQPLQANPRPVDVTRSCTCAIMAVPQKAELQLACRSICSFRFFFLMFFIFMFGLWNPSVINSLVIIFLFISYICTTKLSKLTQWR